MRFFITILLFSFNLFSATYYVSPDGSNSNDGSYENPFATPGYASKRLSPGDTLIILPGVYVLSEYWDDMITPPSGNSDNWITVKGLSPDSRPILKGRNNLFAAIDIGGKSYIRIENLEITNLDGENFREGIDAWDECSHIVLKNLYIHHVDEMGINIKDADFFNIEDCTVSYCGFGGAGGPAGENGGWRNVYVKNSEFSFSGHYYQGGNGPSPYDRPDGIGLEPSNGPLTVENCVFSHNRGDGFDSKCHNTTIKNCIIANNSCDGLKLWGDNSKAVNCLIFGRGDGDLSETPWAGIVVDTPNDVSISFINCTVWQNLDLPGFPIYVQYGESASVNLKMVNCIVSGAQSEIYFGQSVNLEFHHNLIDISGEVKIRHGSQTYSASELNSLGEGNICANPNFVNPIDGESGDFHLKENSSAIDSGFPGSDIPNCDLDGNARPYGNGIDIGCYEYGSSPESSNLSYIPHIAYRNYTTYLLAYSLSESEQNFSISLFNENGYAVVNKTFSVGAYSLRVINLRDMGEELNALCGIVRYSGNMIFKLAYFNTDGGMAEFILDKSTLKKSVAIFPSYNSDITWNGLAIFNPGHRACLLRLSAFKSGREVFSKTITLQPKTNIVDLVESDSFFPSLNLHDFDFILIKVETGNGVCGLNISGENQDKLVFSPLASADGDLEIDKRRFFK